MPSRHQKTNPQGAKPAFASQGSRDTWTLLRSGKGSALVGQARAAVAEGVEPLAYVRGGCGRCEHITTAHVFEGWSNGGPGFLAPQTSPVLSVGDLAQPGL